MSETRANVVIIHGLGGDLRACIPLANAMNQEVVCWSLDLLGHGKRKIPKELSTAAAAQDLLNGLDAAGVEAPYLLGKSYGGRVALHLARHHPSRFRGVCILGTPFDPDFGITRSLFLFDPDRPRENPITDKQRELFRAIHTNMLKAGDAPRELAEEDVRAIRHPALVLCGTEDPIAPVADAEFLTSLLPNGRLALFEGTAHPPDKLPVETVAQLFLEFVRGVEAARASEEGDRQAQPTPSRFGS